MTLLLLAAFFFTTVSIVCAFLLCVPTLLRARYRDVCAKPISCKAVNVANDAHLASALCACTTTAAATAAAAAAVRVSCVYAFSCGHAVLFQCPVPGVCAGASSDDL